MIPLRDRIRALPKHPGVYLFKDAHGRVLYVGKAGSLKHRVSHYVMPGRLEPGKRDLAKRATDVETILTQNEAEALVLEATLIQRHDPPYNVRLVDDSSYLYVKITRETYPKVQFVRRADPDGAWYRGPFPTASAIRTTLREARKLFPWCTAKNPGDQDGEPCFGHHLGLCPGICAGKISVQEYQQHIEALKRFLDGDIRDAIATLRARMTDASMRQHYERAAKLRDAMRAIETATTPQHVVTPRQESLDALGIARSHTHAAVAVLAIRHGRVIGRHIFPLLTPPDESVSSILRGFLLSYYPRAADGPPDILLPEPVEDAALFSQVAHRPLRIATPTRGWKRRLLELARTNAEEALRRSTAELESPAALERALRELQETLHLPYPPRRIEAYDISNIQGTLPTASLVVFRDGKPARREYRKFRITLEEQPNDVAMMREVLQRRLGKHAGGKNPTSDWPLPDVLLLDGGKPQLGAGRVVLQKLQLSIPIAALAKREEELFVPGKEGERFHLIRLSHASPALFLLQRIRDEAHRFTLGYHQLLRKKRMTRSLLDDIPGIGDATRKKLLRAFGSVRALRSASPEELTKVVGPKLAQTLRTALQRTANAVYPVRNSGKP
ncbi:MAG: excinuclease ABC subunit C [Parcubacteria group bacterium Gr01-1014_106]|nr:MAG: excinuclease ABC subunit C [Parcubacteria group bacterium Gr01-1014_106]